MSVSESIKESKDVSKMSVKEIEKEYNETQSAIDAGRGDHKDKMWIDTLDAEIDKRGLRWSGIELEESGKN